RPELFTEQPGAGVELRFGAVDVAEPMFVGGLLRKLEREREAGRSPVDPAADRRFRRRRVEGGVHFYGIESAGVNGQKVRRTRSGGVERAEPCVVIPALGSNPNRRAHYHN